MTQLTPIRRRICKFLASRDIETMRWLERIGPEYIWILNNLYTQQPLPFRELQRLSGIEPCVLKGRRDQALYLLGLRKHYVRQHIRTAQYRLQEFQTRQRLDYIRHHSPLTSGDRAIVDLALNLGVCPLRISAQSTWSFKEATSVLNRLTGAKKLQCYQPGESVRQQTFTDLLSGNNNPKQTLEHSILVELQNGGSLITVARAWEVPQGSLSTIIAEVRTELSRSTHTRKRYGALLREGRASDLRGTNLVRWINASLLPLYDAFRSHASPFSNRELRYIRLRSAGTRIAQAAERAFGLGHVPGTVLERAFLGHVCMPSLEIPDDLPLAPFTLEQEQFMLKVSYTKL